MRKRKLAEMKRRVVLFTFGCFLLAMHPSSALADLVGDEITAEVIWETTQTNWPAGFNVLIPAGTPATVDLSIPEYQQPFFSLGGSTFLIDFFEGPDIGGSTTGLTIAIDFADLAAYPIPETFTVTLSDLDWVDGPGALTDVFKVGGEAGILEVISFTGDSITLAMSNTVFFFGTGFEVEYRYTAQHDGVIAVPEPATLTLFGVGLAGILMMRRGRKALQ